MTGIFGLLTLADTDRVFVTTEGQQALYEATRLWLDKYNADLQTSLAIFVDGETFNHQERYYLPSGGRLDRRGGQAQSAAGKRTGSWDVAYPLEEFGRDLAWDDVSRGYMTPEQYQSQVDTILTQNTGTVRFEMLRALLNNTARTFGDPLNGNLTIQPLANGDSVVYPPVIGSETEATDSHYLESGYAASAISDTNNPLVTIRDELEEHFGAATGYSSIVVFINNAQSAKISGLTNFVPEPDRYVQVGNDTNVPTGLPPVPASARVLGRCDGVWVAEWRYIPANYMLGIHLEAPAPLCKRVDPANTGLGTGLQMVAQEEKHPISRVVWRHRFGFGVRNRLNGVVMELGTGGTYTIPSAYA